MTDGLLRYGLHLGLEVAHQCRLLGGHADEVDQRVDVLYQYGRKVAHQAVWVVQPRAVAAAQYEALAAEEAALGVLAQVDGHGVASTPVVGVVQRLVADGQELALVVRGARRLGEPFHLRGPQQSLFALPHALHVALDVFIRLHGQAVVEVLVVADGGVAVPPSPLGVGRHAYEALQHALLQLGAAVGVLFNLLQAGGKVRPIQKCGNIHLSSFF